MKMIAFVQGPSSLEVLDDLGALAGHDLGLEENGSASCGASGVGDVEVGGGGGRE